MMPVVVVGLGMSPADLSPRALNVIERAQVLAGGRRHLSYFSAHPAEKIPLGADIEKTILRLGELARDRRVVVLASGDPNFYGIAPLLVRLLGAGKVVIHPNLTAVQAAAARLKVPWHEARVVSLHGRSWQALETALREPGRVFIYTDPVHTPAAVARRLREWGRSRLRLCVLEDLGQETERVTWLRPGEAEDRTFSPLNIVVLEAEVPSPAGSPPPTAGVAALHLGMPEEAFSPERGLITKSEVRAVVLAKLELYPGQVLWDVGAGSGSVGLEAALLLGPGRILAVEKNPDRAAQIRANREKFGVANLEVISGRAPECLEELPAPDRVFLGGGGPAVGDILQEVLTRLRPGGRVVVTATRLETLEAVRGVLHQAQRRVEVVQLQVSRVRPLAGGSYFQALNPVWIIAA
jgi:precorrin-6Y C5,15-methyltransferase (decarboxylating)